MLAPDTRLQNRYRILRQLGQGGMGAVYEATDERFGSTVALKQTLVEGDVLRRAFEREARLLNTLQHAGLPHVIDHFFEDNGQFLVMQYIPGDDLGQMLKRRAEAFPVDDVVAWADQLLDLLDYLHTQDPPIIHRDIKPENLKLTKRGGIILLDFGLAKGLAEQAAAATTSSSIVGYTPHYAPLEQIRGTGTDARSDLFALAATLYHLLTRQLPPDALARAEWFLNHQADSLQPANAFNPAVPLPVAAVLHAGLALRRDDRPMSAAVMRTMLRNAAGGSMPLHATDPSHANSATVVVGRTTTPQSFDTAPTAVSFPPAPPTLQPTYPATAMAPPPPERRTSTAAKVIVAVAAVAVLLVVSAAALVIVLYGTSSRAERPSPSPIPSSPSAPEPSRPAGPSGSTPSQPAQPITEPQAPTTGPPTVSASASTVRASMGESSYGPEMALDGRPGTAWVEGAEGPGIGEAISLHLSAPSHVTRIRVEPGYFKSPALWAKNNRVARATVTLSDGRTLDVTFDDEMREQAIPIGGAPIVSVTIAIDDVYYGGDDIDTAISEIAVDTQ